MLNEWDEIDGESQALLEQTFGESFTITPMVAAPNKRPARDRARPVETVCGVLNHKVVKTDVDQDARFGGSNGHTFTKHSQSRVTIQFRRCALAYEIGQHDQIQRVANGRIYEVVDVMSTSTATLTIQVVEKGITSVAP